MPATLTTPVPWDEALAWAATRELLPTSLGSRELRALRQQIGRRALILARVTDARILGSVLNRVSQLARGIQDRPGDYMDPATFRTQMAGVLRQLDYQPEPGREGTISDLRSKARLDLIVRTETELASARAQQTVDLDPDIADAFPAWELYRARRPRGGTRDWEERWRIAAGAAGDTDAEAALRDHGRMIARKDSPLWAELGSTQHFDDALDTDHPPFAFSSGMAVRNVNRATAIEVGVLQRGQRIAAEAPPPTPVRATVADIPPEIRRALMAEVPSATLEDDTLVAQFE